MLDYTLSEMQKFDECCILKETVSQECVQVKGKVSQDCGRLQMLLLDRSEVCTILLAIYF
jgi:hypothetical protein